MDLFALALKINEVGVSQALGHLDTLDRKGERTGVTLGKMSNMAKAFWASMTAGAAALAVKSVVGAALDAERASSELAGALENVGSKMEDWAPHIDAAANKLMDLTRFSDDEFRKAMANMVTLTQNAAGSFQNVGLAADIAAKRHIGLEEASTLVAKAMNGQNTALTRLGISLKDGEDGVAALQARFGGFAEREGKTFGGQLQMIKNQWGELLEEIGKAIIGTDKVTDGTSSFVRVLKDAQKWVIAHRQQIGMVVGAFIDATRVIASFTGTTLRGLEYALRGIAAIVVSFIAGVKEIPEVFRLALGRSLQFTSKFVSGAGYLLEKVFGIESVGQVADAMNKVGQALEEGALANIERLEREGIARMKEVMQMSKRTADAVSEAIGKALPKNAPGFRGEGRAGLPEGIAPKKLPVGIELTGHDISPASMARLSMQIPPLKLAYELPQPSELEIMVANGAAVIQEQFTALAQNVTGTFADALAVGFESGSIKEAGKALLAGLGSIFIEMGKTIIQFGVLMEKLFAAITANPLLAGPIGIAVGVALIALGSALKGAAKGGRGSGATGGGGVGGAGGGNTDLHTRVILGTTAASQGGNVVQPAQPVNVWLVGKDDPQASRDLLDMIYGAERRGITGK